MSPQEPQDLSEYKVAGLAMKSDFDFMIKKILEALDRHAKVNGNALDWEYTRQIILDYVNNHRRDMAEKYAVIFRDFMDREYAMKRYRKKVDMEG